MEEKDRLRKNEKPSVDMDFLKEKRISPYIPKYGYRFLKGESELSQQESFWLLSSNISSLLSLQIWEISEVAQRCLGWNYNLIR